MFVPCDETEYETEEDGQKACKPLTICSGAHYESTPPTNTSDRDCARLTVCVAGQRQVVAATTTADRECAACEPGSYSASNGSLVCTPHSVCGAEEFEVLPGESTAGAVWQLALGCPGCW